MELRSLVALIGAVLTLAACASTPEPAGERLKLIDLTPEVARAWEQTAALPDAERVSAFKAHFVPILPGFYSHERFRMPAPGPYDERLLAGLKAYPQQRAGIEEVSRRFAAMLTPAQKSFEREFGPMRGYAPIYLVNSFGEFDGGTRRLPGGGYLMFGADVIARLHLKHNIRPFFHHELFHLFHARTFRECEQLWCGLWSEGMAVYAAARLNPGASDAELLLTEPQSLRAAIEANRKEAICTVLARRDSTLPADSRALFSSGRLNERLPPRFGYYVGYLVAAEAGKSRSLRELAALAPEQARPIVEASLRSLADCAD